jgi:hypothetical protein
MSEFGSCTAVFVVWLQQDETVETSNSADSAIVKDTAQFTDENMCFKLTAEYRSISKLFHDLHKEKYRDFGNWKDEKQKTFNFVT